MKKYNNKLEAQQISDKYNKDFKNGTRNLGYCPLIKEKCNPECVAFIKSVVLELPPSYEQFHPTFPSCNYFQK